MTWWRCRWLARRQENRCPQGAISQNPTRPSTPADLSGYSQIDKQTRHSGIFIDKICIRPCIPRRGRFQCGYLHQHRFFLWSPMRSTNKNQKTVDHRSNNTKPRTHRSLYWGLLCPVPVSFDKDWGSRLKFGTIHRSSKWLRLISTMWNLNWVSISVQLWIPSSTSKSFKARFGAKLLLITTRNLHEHTLPIYTPSKILSRQHQHTVILKLEWTS